MPDPSDFQQAVYDKIEALQVADSEAAGPGHLKAVDWTRIKGGLAAVDALVQKYEPIASSFAPAQWKLVADMVATALHVAVNGLPGQPG